MEVESFFDKDTFTLTYTVFDRNSKDCIVIDPVLNYDHASGKLNCTSYDQVKSFILKENLNIHFVLETHAHADHISSSQLFKKDFPNVKIGIGQGITLVQETFKKTFNLSERFHTDGSQFDKLFTPNEQIFAGTLVFKAIPTPGHTPACMSYLFDSIVFTGDTLFMPDYGTGRCDFPKGSSSDLFDSISKNLYSLPDETLVYVGHDYLPGGRELAFKSTIKDQKEHNIQMNKLTTKNGFIEFRNSRDSKLSAPKLLLPSIQINIDGGRLPEKEANGLRYLKIPLSGL